MPQHDAIIIGSGPNGLAAAIELARNGWSVRVYEKNSTVGGGTRTHELTLPGFKHDMCSAIHPLGLGSPFFSQLPLGEYGLEWLQPEINVAHPLDGGQAAALYRSVEQTADALGRDGSAYHKLMHPLVERWDAIADFILGPLRIPSNLIAAAHFGIRALPPTSWLAEIFREDEAKALLAGLAAHSFLPMGMSPSAAFGLVLGVLGHSVGWALPKGGSQSIADALAAHLRDLGGEIMLETHVDTIDMLPSARVYLFDTTPTQLLHIAGRRLPDGFYKSQLENYRYGPGVFKVDWALSEPIPWANEACRHAGTVHLGGTLGEIDYSERLAWEGIHCDKPYVLLAQQSIVDDTRAPDGQHTGWAYCHVPHGSTRDMTEIITAQVERFAPGFRDTILETHTMNTADYEAYNPNNIGGDINGGIADWFQLFTRPAVKLRPYTTPADDIYLCSASTPPGGGVHGMCGYHAARAVLWDNR